MSPVFGEGQDNGRTHSSGVIFQFQLLIGKEDLELSTCEGGDPSHPATSYGLKGVGFTGRRFMVGSYNAARNLRIGCSAGIEIQIISPLRYYSLQR